VPEVGNKPPIQSRMRMVIELFESGWFADPRRDVFMTKDLAIYLD